MRALADPERIQRFLRRLGESAPRASCRLYLTGGATAVLLGWRPSTIDVDLSLRPDRDEILRAIARLKDELSINVELACPSDFVPELPGWEGRSPFVERVGSIDVHHYDPYGQALAKIERGHTKDLADVEEMRNRGLVEPARLLELFEAVRDRLHRYPALDAPTLEREVRSWVDAALAGDPPAR